MATATVARRDLKVKDQTFLWEGVDRNNKSLRGEVRAVSETVATTNLRRQGIRVTKIKRQSFRGGRSIGDKDRAALTAFLDEHAAHMPRAMLSNAVEKFAPAEKAHYRSLKPEE